MGVQHNFINWHLIVDINSHFMFWLSNSGQFHSLWNVFVYRHRYLWLCIVHSLLNANTTDISQKPGSDFESKRLWTIKGSNYQLLSLNLQCRPFWSKFQLPLTCLLEICSFVPDLLWCATCLGARYIYLVRGILSSAIGYDDDGWIAAQLGKFQQVFLCRSQRQSSFSADILKFPISETLGFW